jgi:hypothetical protein
MFPHTRYPILAPAGAVPRPSLSISRERTLSLQGGCDVDGYQEGGDRVEDASEYERGEFEDEGHENSGWTLCAQWVDYHPPSRRIQLGTWIW